MNVYIPLKIMNPKLYVVSLYAQDIPAAAHFYRDVIGLPPVAHHGQWPHFDLGGAYLVILPGQPPQAQERFPQLAIAVDDLDAAVSRMRAHQVDLPWDMETGQGSRWVMFRDPGGNLVELVQAGE